MIPASSLASQMQRSQGWNDTGAVSMEIHIDPKWPKMSGMAPINKLGSNGTPRNGRRSVPKKFASLLSKN